MRELNFGAAFVSRRGQEYARSRGLLTGNVAPQPVFRPLIMNCLVARLWLFLCAVDPRRSGLASRCFGVFLTLARKLPQNVAWGVCDTSCYGV